MMPLESWVSRHSAIPPKKDRIGGVISLGWAICDSESVFMAELRPHSLTRRNRRALPMTDSELNVIAAAAIIGLRRTPKKG
jgi:hypothetical protein